MSRPIGIFDSGIGGLTVFRALASLLPGEDLVYLGDTARVPYGTKSPRTVTRYSLQNIRFLRQQEAKLVVVACNTASAFALEEVRREFDLPVVGVIEPGVAGALKKTKRGRIGVIGTEGTIASGAYSKAIGRLSPQTKVFEAACPLFVPLVEEGWTGGEVPETAARRYLSPLLKNDIDTLILGCTHYPLLKKVIAEVTGPEVTLIDSAEETAREVGRLLQEKSLLEPGTKESLRRFFVTDHPDRFRRVGELFLGGLTDVEQVDL